LNRDLVIPFIDLNFGPQENYPELVLRAVENDDLTVLTSALEKLVPLGLKVEQSVVRDKLGLPDPEKDAELLGSPSPQTEPVKEAANNRALNRVESNQEHKGCACNRSESEPTVETALFDWMKEQSSGPAAGMIDSAEQLLNQVESLDEFRERLIDLFAATEPERLAETMARLELLGKLAGRVEAKEE
jgi:phage gp29-like protein